MSRGLVDQPTLTTLPLSAIYKGVGENTSWEVPDLDLSLEGRGMFLEGVGLVLVGDVGVDLFLVGVPTTGPS